MYTLILVHSERMAIDWVGDRYATGYEFKQKLYLCGWDAGNTYDIVDWEIPSDISFRIPEHIAWEIRDLFETEEMLFPCFASEFVEKLKDFYYGVV